MKYVLYAFQSIAPLLMAPGLVEQLGKTPVQLPLKNGLWIDGNSFSRGQPLSPSYDPAK